MDDVIYRQEAIDALDVLCQEHRYKVPGKGETYSQYNEAWQDALDRAEGAIFNLPSADAVNVVRCKDCKWFNDIGCAIRIVDDSDKPTENDYCSFGERKDGLNQQTGGLRSVNRIL